MNKYTIVGPWGIVGKEQQEFSSMKELEDKSQETAKDLFQHATIVEDTKPFIVQVYEGDANGTLKFSISVGIVTILSKPQQKPLKKNSNTKVPNRYEHGPL